MNKEILNKIKKGSVIVTGALVLTMPLKTNANTNKTIYVNNESKQNINYAYIKQKDSFVTIKMNGKSLRESFVSKAKFLLGEENYNNYYLTNINIMELQKQYDSIYGDGTFIKLKEYDFRTNGMTYDDLLAKNGSISLSLSYELKQQSIFPNSDFKDERKNIIDKLILEKEAINNILSNKKDTYNTLYDMNEFVTGCVGNALAEKKYHNPIKIYETYCNEIMDPIVICYVHPNGQIIDIDATDFRQYPNYNLIKNNPEEYGISSSMHLTKRK